MTRILVTGGVGFIGSALCHYLCRDIGAEVLCFDKLTYAAHRASVAPLEGLSTFRLVTGDVADRAAVSEALNTFAPSHIIHLAAESHVDRSIDAPDDFMRSNILGTYTLLEAVRAFQAQKGQTVRLLHVSTDEVFGSLGETGAFTDQSRYDPSSPYSASKAASDHLVRAWGRTYGLSVLISNCSNNYGPRQFPEKLIPLCLINALEGKPVPIYGKGDQVRDWLHVEDHARALWDIVSRGTVGETYLVGARQERDNLSLVTRLLGILQERVPSAHNLMGLITHVADRPAHDTRYAIDPAKIERELGFKPRYSLDDGLEQTVDWYLSNTDWWRPLRDRYDGARLGL